MLCLLLLQRAFLKRTTGSMLRFTLPQGIQAMFPQLPLTVDISITLDGQAMVDTDHAGEQRHTLDLQSRPAALQGMLQPVSHCWSAAQVLIIIWHIERAAWHAYGTVQLMREFCWALPLKSNKNL